MAALPGSMGPLKVPGPGVVTPIPPPLPWMALVSSPTVREHNHGAQISAQRVREQTETPELHA